MKNIIVAGLLTSMTIGVEAAVTYEGAFTTETVLFQNDVINYDILTPDGDNVGGRFDFQSGDRLHVSSIWTTGIKHTIAGVEYGEVIDHDFDFNDRFLASNLIDDFSNFFLERNSTAYIAIMLDSNFNDEIDETDTFGWATLTRSNGGYISVQETPSYFVESGGVRAGFDMPVASVPEPSSSALLGLSGVALILRRKR